MADDLRATGGDATAGVEHPACARGIDRLLEVVARLRGRDGCPWDREQTLETLKPYLIEESYEVIEAVDSGHVDRHKEELGDVLLQVALHARIREEQGAFDFDAVARGLAEKLVRRHPHVFGHVRAETAADVLRNWEALKAEEKKEGDPAILAGVPRHLPALQKAQRVQSRAARVGFDWPDTAGVLDKLEEELAETRAALESGDAAHVKEELGDLLFSIVNLCRHLDVRAEEALQATSAKFMTRFRHVEACARAGGRALQDCTLEEMDAHWDAAKAASRPPGFDVGGERTTPAKPSRCPSPNREDPGTGFGSD